MAHIENTTQNRKYKHLSPFERGKIVALHKAGHSNREIARRLGRVHQTIANELKRGTTTQLKTGRKPYTAYFPETGQAVYEKNRKNCGAKSKLLVSSEFIEFAYEKILKKGWSPDAVVGFVKRKSSWKNKTIVSTECHNGLLRRYIPKGKAVSDYSRQAIKRIYQTLNHLPRKILDYQQPAVLFEQELARLV